LNIRFFKFSKISKTPKHSVESCGDYDALPFNTWTDTETNKIGTDMAEIRGGDES